MIIGIKGDWIMVYWLIGALVYILVNLMFASLMNSVAISKGYESSNAFILVFLFGIFGILYVISLPDLKARQQREDIIAILLSEDKGGK